MSFPPEIYLIGAQKAGTTTLAYLLDQHPRPHHRPDEGTAFLHRPLAERPGLVPQAIPRRIDHALHGCIDQLRDGTLDGRMAAERSPGVRGRSGQGAFGTPGREVHLSLTRPGGPDLLGVLARCADGCQERSVQAAVQRNPFYLDVSDYHGQLLRWLEYFPLSSFHFVLFERMKDHPHEVVNDCLTFLGYRRPIRSPWTRLRTRVTRSAGSAARSIGSRSPCRVFGPCSSLPSPGASRPWSIASRPAPAGCRP